MLSEIKEVNASYILLAQHFAREGRNGAAVPPELGLNERLADVLAGLSVEQIDRLAASSQLLCRFRFDDKAILSALTHTGRAATVAKAAVAA